MLGGDAAVWLSESGVEGDMRCEAPRVFHREGARGSRNRACPPCNRGSAPRDHASCKSRTAVPSVGYPLGTANDRYGAACLDTKRQGPEGSGQRRSASDSHIA